MAAHARPARPVRPIGRAADLARPARRVRAEDVIGFLVGNGLIIALLWWYHGGLDQLTTVAGIATATGQLTALYGTYLALIQLLLMSRAPALDRIFGRDQLTLAHRWIGFATVWLLVAHGVFTTVGFALDGGESPLAEFWTLNTTWDFVLMATVSLGLFIAVAVTSVRLARKRISYESWYGIHLYAYLAVALGFAHQLVVGTRLHRRPARPRLLGRPVRRRHRLPARLPLLGPDRAQLRHRFQVANVIAEGPGVWSVYLSGRELGAIDIRAGQYLVVRFLAPAGGAPIRIRSRPSPTVVGCGSRSRPSATTRRGSTGWRWAPGSSSRVRTAT